MGGVNLDASERAISRRTQLTIIILYLILLRRPMYSYFSSYQDIQRRNGRNIEKCVQVYTL